MPGFRIAAFEFKPLATTVVVAMLALLLSLGTWQWNKAGFKRAMIERFDKSTDVFAWNDIADGTPERYVRVELTGRYLADRQVLMDGLSRNGVPGVQVLSPLRLDSGETVMINRGWRAFEGTRDVPVVPRVPVERRTVRGRVRAFAQPGMRLGDGNASVKPTWPRLAIYPQAGEIAEWLGTPVASTLVLLDADEPDGFVREWRPDGFPPSRHVGYAVQWYGLAMALFVLYLIACRTPARAENAK